MDPKACLIAASEALQDGNVYVARDALEDYWRWRDGDGFEPTMDDGRSGDAFAADLREEVLDAANPRY